jgi:transposase-like protein
VPVAFTRLDPSQWNSARTTDAIEWLNEEFRPRIKSQSVPPSAESVPMPLRVLSASGPDPDAQGRWRGILGQTVEPIALEPVA